MPFGTKNEPPKSDPETKPVENKVRKLKIGLALGAGVARGWAHIGVLKGLAKEGIVPDVVAGTSIGAVVGGAYSCNNLDALEDWAFSLKDSSFFRFLDLKLAGSGLFGSERLDQLMKERFGDWRFEDLRTPFTAVACDLKTGHEVWLNSGNLSDGLRASFALPGVFEPQNIDGQWLVDGALVNPVPVSVCRAAGCDLVIAVNLAEDIYGRARAKRAGALGNSSYGVFENMETLADKPKNTEKSFFRKLFRHKKDAPSLFTNMVASLNIMQNRLSRSRLAGDPPDVTFTPRCGHIGLMEFHRCEELIEEGTRAFETGLPQLRDAMAIIHHRINS